MKLNEFLDKGYQSIVIQCHNDPDADTVASGYALYCYFKLYVMDVKLVYGGYHEIIKSNMVAMVREFDIPIIYLNTLETIPDLLITVDCQYGERNVVQLEGDTVAVIDHHKFNRNNTRASYVHVKDTYGSCSTVVWEMLREAGSDLIDDKRIATLLYYGLYMDTCQLKEIYHLKDRIMRDKLFKKYDEVKLNLLQNENITLFEIKDIIGPAYTQLYFCEKFKYCIATVSKCDPNILGIISDQVLEISGNDISIAYCDVGKGYKISVRSCTPKSKANDIASFITCGNGGGHNVKAGGFIPKDILIDSDTIMKYLVNRIECYFTACLTVYHGCLIDLKDFDIYKKLDIKIKCCHIADVYPIGDLIRIKSLEGDFDLAVMDDLYIMVGVNKEVYYCYKDYLYEHYKVDNKTFVNIDDSDRQHLEDCVSSLDKDTLPYTDYLMNCYSLHTNWIYAKRLDQRAKVFDGTGYNYFAGNVGDWLVANPKEPGDYYIISKDIFDKLYEKQNSDVGEYYV